MKKIVAIDPGGTIGFAVVTGEKLDVCGTFRNEPEAVDTLLSTIEEHDPAEIVIEAFRLYPWMAKTQSWSTFETVEVIGTIKHWAWQHGYPVIMQPAANKQPFPDARLEKMDMYVPNEHARDAIRHALYRQRFGQKESDRHA